MADAGPVICAIDDSEAARHAVRAATWLARSLDATLVLAHAFDPIADDDLERAARGAALRLLGETAQAATGVDVATMLAEGQVVPELRALAAAQRATLLVTGTAARGGLDRVLLGSVSGELAASAPCPVVTVPRGAALEEPGPVVAGYDGSSHSLHAARHAAALAVRLRRELVLLHVTDGEALWPDEHLVRELNAGVRGGNDPGRPTPDLTVRLGAEDGDPVQVLAAVARERAAALLVAGTRGRNALSSAPLGSVSLGLVRAAGRPVALVPPTAAETPAGR